MSPSARSNDTMSGISSLAASKHSSSSHTSVCDPHTDYTFSCFFSAIFLMLICIIIFVPLYVRVYGFKTRVPPSPNQSAAVATPLEGNPVTEELGMMEDANAENLYLMGNSMYF